MASPVDQEPIVRPKEVQKPHPALVGLKVIVYIAGHCISRTLTAPYERIKLLQQLSTFLPVSYNGKFQESNPGSLALFKSIVKNEGFFSLWRGNLCGCLSVIPMVIVRTAITPYLRILIVRHDPHRNYLLYLLEELLEEGISTTMALLLAHPFTVLHSRIASDLSPQGFKAGIFSHVYTVWTNHGLFGIYRGITIAILSALIQKASFVLITEFCRRYVVATQADAAIGESKKKRMKVLNFLNTNSQNWVVAHICTHASLLFTFPLDTICKCCMALDIPIHRTYEQITHVGRAAFYRGIYIHFISGTLFGATLVLLNQFKTTWFESWRSHTKRYRLFHPTH